ncbi:MAG: glycosyltransferase family 2 protein [Nitrospirales bacterium]|nr:glycosyltransferase family 2 protein [Nitrospira sp.]MDR4502197.1 glycosyltransferase family 2 protein [Nitrospirales bacterium]
MDGVTAIVVNYNGGQDIIRCLQELHEREHAFEELLVIDNGSSDGSATAIQRQFPNVHVIELGENVGPAQARNVGLERAKSPLALLIDDDVYLSSISLELLRECLRHEQATVVVPRLVLVPENVIQADGADIHFTGTMILRHSRDQLVDAPATPMTIGTFSSSCILADRRRIIEAGGFDGSFFIYQEDMELGLRLRSLGHRLVCEPRAVGYHDRGRGTPGLSFRDHGLYPRRRGYLTMRNRLRTILLHYRLRTLALLLPVFVAYEVCSAIFAAGKGWFTAWLQAWWWQIKQIPEIAQRRQWIQHRRRIEDKDLLMGGPLPLAPGVLQSQFQIRLVAGLSWAMDTYWCLCRPLLSQHSPTSDDKSAHEVSSNDG